MQGESSYRAGAPSRRKVLAMLGGLVLMTAGCAEDLAAPVDQETRRSQAAPPTGSRSPTSRTSSPAPPTSPAETTRPTSAPSAHTSAGATPTPGSPSTQTERARSVKRYVASHPRQLALTLDDGPAPYWTERILDILERYDVTATFCMVGRSVAERPDLARMVTDRGHLLANHTWDHANLTRASNGQVAEEIERTQAILHHVTGRTPTYFRAPYGAWSSSVTEACARSGLRPLGWSVDPQDWTRPPVSVLVSRLLGDIAPGAIVLEHDGGGDRSHTVAALSVVIPRLLDQGYRFVTP